MNDASLKVLITEAVQLDRRISIDEERLKGLKSQLIAEAKTRKDEHTATAGKGKSWVGHGCDGCVCRVTFPAKPLRGSLPGEGDDLEKVMALAGTSFGDLFTEVITYKPVDDFRTKAAELLEDESAKLIKAMSGSAKTSVSFETKES